MSHIFRPKLDIVSEPYMSFNASTLQRCAISISKTINAFLLGKYFCQYFRRHVYTIRLFSSKKTVSTIKSYLPKNLALLNLLKKPFACWKVFKYLLAFDQES